MEALPEEMLTKTTSMIYSVHVVEKVKILLCSYPYIYRNL